jgi:hypothetical protein
MKDDLEAVAEMLPLPYIQILRTWWKRNSVKLRTDIIPSLRM